MFKIQQLVIIIMSKFCEIITTVSTVYPTEFRNKEYHNQENHIFSNIYYKFLKITIKLCLKLLFLLI